MKLRSFLPTLLLLSMLGCSDHGFSEDEFPVRSVVVNGTDYKYRVYIPEKRDASQKIPVMLYLHGSGARGDENQGQLAGMAPLIAEYKERFNFAIVFPQCRRDTFWAGEMNEQAMAALDQTIKEVNGDETRIYLMGYSMGGYGTWQLSVAHPGKFAALVPIAGGIVPNGRVSDEDMALLAPRVRAAAESVDPYRAFANELKNVPVWIFHGEADEVVRPEGSRKMAEALKAAGNTHVKYTEFAALGHDAIGKTLREPGLFEWLTQQRLPGK